MIVSDEIKIPGSSITQKPNSTISVPHLVSSGIVKS